MHCLCRHQVSAWVSANAPCLSLLDFTTFYIKLCEELLSLNWESNLRCAIIKSVQDTRPFNEWVHDVINLNVGLLGTISYCDNVLLQDFLELGLHKDTKHAIQAASIPWDNSFKVWCDKVQVLNDYYLATECSILSHATSMISHLRINPAPCMLGSSLSMTQSAPLTKPTCYLSYGSQMLNVLF